jgi:hypothetical protein
MELGIKSLQHIGIPTTDIGASESSYPKFQFMALSAAFVFLT